MGIVSLKLVSMELPVFELGEQLQCGFTDKQYECEPLGDDGVSIST